MVEQATLWRDQSFDQLEVRQLNQLLDNQEKQENKEELSDCFSGALDFGTAGLRGILGPGPNRMNKSVVAHTCLGLAKVLKKHNKKTVVIGFDARDRSEEFALLSAGILLKQGIAVIFFEKFAATPLVAFALLKEKADCAIVVTASHNPPAYNGYKVYWSNGAQIIPPVDKEIKTAKEVAGPANEIAFVAASQVTTNTLYRSAEFLRKEYITAASQLSPMVAEDVARDLRIAYTPLHGVGAETLQALFSNCGFTNLFTVKEQEKPDASFATVEFPNPEEAGALDLLLKLAQDKDCDIAIANDPDADRLSVAIKEQDGWSVLNGNQIGAILGHYLLSLAANKKNSLLISTIVSSTLLEKIAKSFSAQYAECLTGFKWIANTALTLEKKFGYEFIYGFEEALGSTVGTLVRDKDGISAALVFAKLAAELKSKGTDVGSYLEKIYHDYGYHANKMTSISFSATDGMSQMDDAMSRLRSSQARTLAGLQVHKVIDVLNSTEIDFLSGENKNIDLPASNVLIYQLENDIRIIVRPSGTEPKLKIYYEVCSQVGERNLADVKSETKEILEKLAIQFTSEANLDKI